MSQHYLGWYCIFIFWIVQLYTTPHIENDQYLYKCQLNLGLQQMEQTGVGGESVRSEPEEGEEIEGRQAGRRRRRRTRTVQAVEDQRVWFCDGGDRQSSELRTDLIPSLPPGCALRVASLRWGAVSRFSVVFWSLSRLPTVPFLGLKRSFMLSRPFQPH